MCSHSLHNTSGWNVRCMPLSEPLAPVKATWHPRSRPIPATDNAVTHAVHPGGLILLSVALPPLPCHPAPCVWKKRHGWDGVGGGILPHVGLHPPSQLPPGAYSWRRITAASRASELDSRDSAKAAGHLTQTQGPSRCLCAVLPAILALSNDSHTRAGLSNTKRNKPQIQLATVALCSEQKVIG